jgi:hypothetical protein
VQQVTVRRVQFDNCETGRQRAARGRFKLSNNILNASTNLPFV